MTANRYDQAAEAPIMNTYVPINFGELYRIGATQKAAVDEAAKQFSTALQKFGEFRSPSAVDTQNWYNLTINRKDVQNAINQIANNPDAMKDASFRANLQSLINSTDYSSLSLLKESADNLRAGLEMRAKMEAEGKYKEGWDDSNIPQYDTLGNKRVFSDITPVRYMTADELSNPYFSNLKPSSLGSVWKDGVKYNRAGITYDTLYDIANARFNDLVSTPQGQKYYKEALQAAGGNESVAREAFVGMIADSQRDRIVNQDTVDPLWLIQAKHAASRTGKDEIIRPKPTRLDFLNESITRSVQSRIGSRFDQYRNYIEGLISKYPNTKIAQDAKKGVQNIDNMMNSYMQLNQAAMQYSNAYRATGNDNDLIVARSASDAADRLQAQMIGLANKHVLRDEFQKVSGFSPISVSGNKEYSKQGYLKGVNSALDMIKGNVSLLESDDLLTGIGGSQQEVKDENGTTKNVYQFNDSRGFLLPETVFQIASETTPRKAERVAGIGRDTSFPLKEVLESGNLADVQFLPEGKMVKVGPGTFALSGKIRIPKETIEQTLGTGLWSDKGLTRGFADNLVAPFGRQSTRTALKDLYKAAEVTEVVGEDGHEYFEMNIFKTLPNTNNAPEFWQRVNQRWQGGSPTGIGGTTQAKEEYGTSALQTLGMYN